MIKFIDDDFDEVVEFKEDDELEDFRERINELIDNLKENKDSIEVRIKQI
jgi:hypothetical protein